MLSLDGKPQENSGRVIGAALCWSGNYELRIDTENDYCHYLYAGISSEAMEYRLEPNTVFTTPKLALTYSREGMSGASRNFHRWARAGTNGIHTRPTRDDIKIYPIDAMEATLEIGNSKAYNMVVMGALLNAMDYKLPMENVIKGLKKSLPERHHKLIPLNEKAIEKGKSLI